MEPSHNCLPEGVGEKVAKNVYADEKCKPFFLSTENIFKLTNILCCTRHLQKKIKKNFRDQQYFENI